MLPNELKKKQVGVDLVVNPKDSLDQPHIQHSLRQERSPLSQFRDLKNKSEFNLKTVTQFRTLIGRLIPYQSPNNLDFNSFVLISNIWITYTVSV